jgi:hypothetical protein
LGIFLPFFFFLLYQKNLSPSSSSTQIIVSFGVFDRIQAVLPKPLFLCQKRIWALVLRPRLTTFRNDDVPVPKCRSQATTECRRFGFSDEYIFLCLGELPKKKRVTGLWISILHTYWCRKLQIHVNTLIFRWKLNPD